MTHTLLRTAINAVAALFFASGLGLMATQAAINASVSGVGSSIIEAAPTHEAAAIISQEIVEQTSNNTGGGMQLIIGVVLILIGLFIHGFVHVPNERPVHITIAPPRRKPRVMSWFWVEMKV